MGNTVSSMANGELQKSMMRLNMTQKLNSAADDASGLAIAEKLEAEINGLSQGTRNTEDMDNAIQIADGGLASIGDSLQRLGELSTLAANGTNSPDDIAIYQNEANELLEGISDVVGSLQYNNQKLLDGTFTNRNTASGADGSGRQVSIGEMSVEALGLTDFNIAESTAKASVDSAIATVSAQRSSLGSVSNTFAHTIGSNDIASLNLAASRSRIADTDIANEASDAQRQQVLRQYNMAMQRDEQRRVNPASPLMQD